MGKAIISNLLNIHIETWKTYYDRIYGNNNTNQRLVGYVIHEISATKKELHEFINEQSKWFNIGDTDV